ncbi:NACHT domain-containing protein [Stackebrandtia endophytica]|uniref:NACHT domain-containing protein n=1 Tax=Stackebrandtia endophytica TaxID=1496996 RepID=UPI001476D5F8|nr:NACHT domain-containing protein [Stackebrandtia endophytica]
MSETIVTSVLATLALAPPGLVVSQAWDWIQDNPVISALAVIAYWMLLAVVSLFGRVGREVGDRWVKRIADRVDLLISGVLLGHRRAYLRRSQVDVRDLELQGVITQPAFAPRLAPTYVDVSLDPRATGAAAEELRTRWEPGRRRPLDHFLDGDDTGVFTISGYPGSGKTSLLRHAMDQRCGGGVIRRHQLPVLLYLRDHVEAILDVDRRANVADLAVSVPWLAGKIPATWLQRRLERGKCLVMFDGLDEVGDAPTRRKVADWVGRQMKSYSANTFVITSRPHGFDDNVLRNTTRLHIRSFTVQQISDFVHRWYYEIERRQGDHPEQLARAAARRNADGLLDRLRRRPALYDLASNPLLLTMIANVHKYRGALPGTRAELYREMCEMLLVRRREEKGVINPAVVDLKTSQRLMLVGKLALAMMDIRVRDIDAGTARRVLDDALRRVPVEVTAQDVLDDLKEGGMLIVRRPGSYAFPHLTLQEYMASIELSQHNRVDLLAERVDDPWWRETILLWTDVADASDVVEECLRSGSIHALSLAFECADSPREIEPALRSRLAELLQDRIPSDDGGRAMVAAVKVSHDLHEVIHLGENLVVCARPVNNAVWRLFQADMQSQGCRPAPDSTRVGRPDRAAEGIWSWDVEPFIDWVNSFFDDGTAYRMLSLEELDDPAVTMAVDTARVPVWAAGAANRPVLYRRPGAPDPQRASEIELRDMIADDRRATSAHLFVALAYQRAAASDDSFLERFNRALDFTHIYEFATAWDEGADTDPALAGALNYVLARHRFLNDNPGIDPDLDPDRSLTRVTETDMVRRFTRHRLLPESLRRSDLSAIRAYLLLIPPWIADTDNARAGHALTDFDAHLSRMVEPDSPSVAPQEITTVLRRAAEYLTDCPGIREGQHESLRGLALRVINDVSALLTPFLARRAGYDPVVSRIARIDLSAAVSTADLLARHSEDPDLWLATDLLRGALHTLIAIEARVGGRLSPGEQLLLARA